jgi:uncharacterized protein YbjQ (UPF0145 family)
MGFLDRLLGGSADDDPALAADIARVSAGGIPLAAEQRIRELAGRETAFTSGLSIADFALTHGAGVRPVCQVMGSSVYKIGWQNYPWGSGWTNDGSLTELRQLTDAWNHARALALGRLQEEARLAGCHAVVDVSFDGKRHAFLSDEIEIVVNGTAVHLPERHGAQTPVLTDLSLPDYILLRRGGYRPVGVVASTSVFYIVPGRQTRQATTGWQQRYQPNQELTDFTQGIYAARETALGRASAQAHDLGAGGLIGVTVDHGIEIREVESGGSKREDLIVTFHILGTAIAPSGDHQPLDPQVVLRQGAR